MRYRRTLTVVVFGVVFGVAALVVGGSRPARADDTRKAAELFRQATAHYNLGHFLEAATGYERIYESHPDSALLYNIAQAYRLAGAHEEKALFFYRSYLAQTPRSIHRVEVEERIASLDKIVSAQKSVRDKPPNEASRVESAATTLRYAPPLSSTSTSTSTSTPTSRKPAWVWPVVGVGVGVVIAGVAIGLGVGLSSGQAARFDTNLPDGGPGGGL